jgi:hypothetical protein
MSYYDLTTDSRCPVVKLLLCIYEIPGLSLGPETGFPTVVFRVCSQFI